MIVFTEASSTAKRSSSTRDLAQVTQAARLSGCRVYSIPEDFSVCQTAENALAHIPKQSQKIFGVWIGYLPSWDRYQSIYQAAKEKNIFLVNTPEEHQTSMDFSLAYPLLKELTPKSMMLTDVTQSQEIIETLGAPVFVKGAVQSKKHQGWKACVANSVYELEHLAKSLLQQQNYTREKVVVRRLARLKHARTSQQGFPLGREYRVFLYRANVLAFGYYWEGDDPFQKLNPNEKDTVLQLATEAAKRLKTPYVAIDIGQQENDKWIVIEPGDAQFAGLSQTSSFLLWNQLALTKFY